MVWTEITRRHYRRDGLRYESDTTDAEWLAMEPLLPPASALGRPRATDMRTVIDAILYIASTGCQWRQLPKDFPPYSTVQGYLSPHRRGAIAMPAASAHEYPCWISSALGFVQLNQINRYQAEIGRAHV